MRRATASVASGAVGRRLHIRDFREQDAEAAAGLIRDAAPYFLATADLLVHDLRSTPARAGYRILVAEDGGRLVGLADALLRWRARDPGVGFVWVCVAPDQRRQGIGAALAEASVRHVAALGAHMLNTEAEPESVGFAERYGFGPTRSEQLWEIEPAEADLSGLDALEQGRAAEGFRLVPLRELLDRPRELHALYAEVEDDVPTDYPRGELPFEEWERETLGKPLLDPDGSMNVVHDGRPVAFAWLLIDREGRRGEHELTGTLPGYRGRGLARLAKLSALRWAADNGIERLFTGNDEENEPMLAINRRLGYRPGPVWVELAKPVARAPPRP
jgi:GNAT superfamily N-acetyltransferase